MRLFVIVSNLLTLFYVQTTYAFVAIAHPEASIGQYRVWLSQQEDTKSLAQLSTEKNYRVRKQLENEFENAQSKFISATWSDAILRFKKISEMAFTQDWDNSGRQIIFYSLLRLAQLESSEQKYWLQKASQFAPDLSPDPDVFSPQLQKEFELTLRKEKEQSRRWNPYLQLKSIDSVYVNGRHINDSSIILLRGKQRITISSHSHMPIHLVTTAEELQRLNINWNDASTGDCDHITIHKEMNELRGVEKIKVFVNDSCVLEETANGEWQKVIDNKFVASKVKQNSLVAFSQTSLQPNAAPFWKKGWFWTTIIGVAVGAVIYTDYQSKNKTIRPTHESHE